MSKHDFKMLLKFILFLCEENKIEDLKKLVRETIKDMEE
jgi:hypothetical protein